MFMSILPVHIEDVTVTTDLKTDIPLEKMVNTEKEADYDADGSNGIVYKIKEPRATALIFSDGKVVCTGTKSIREAEEAMRIIVERIVGLGVKATEDPETEVEKIVAAFRLKDTVNLDDVSGKLKGATYDKAKVPAVVYKLSGTDADFLILENKIICTGCKSIKGVQKAMMTMKATLEKTGINIELV